MGGLRPYCTVLLLERGGGGGFTITSTVRGTGPISGPRPHQSAKSDPDPDPHQSEMGDPDLESDPYQSGVDL
jgi:hypothetical protein